MVNPPTKLTFDRFLRERAFHLSSNEILNPSYPITNKQNIIEQCQLYFNL